VYRTSVLEPRAGGPGPGRQGGPAQGRGSWYDVAHGPAGKEERRTMPLQKMSKNKLTI